MGGYSLNFRRLEVTGFKSFADKAELALEPGITAVVGPNGCGKSNIADAIKWALGEQNAKALRCEKMEDLIFNGGSVRRPLGMSQVSLVMLNADNKLETQYTEVEIERRFFRSGEGEYYINRNRCLLKDIHELFMDTGLGINSYSIMEQGHIDLILNSSPQDRRLIIEEAAGITKFRHRKKTTLKKLEATEQNILRINDILHELEQQVASLKRQESRARTYQRYYSDLKSFDTTLSKRKYENLTAELKNTDNKVTDLDDKARSISTNTTKLESDLENLRLEITQLDAKLSDIRIEERKIQGKIEEAESNIAVLKERKTNLQQQRQRTHNEITRITQRIQEQEKQLDKIIAERDKLSEAISKQESELKESQSSADLLSQTTKEAEKSIEELKAQVIESLNKRARIQNELSATESRLDYLTNRRERLTTDSESFRTEHAQLKDSLEKIQTDIEEKEEKISDLTIREEQLTSEIDKLRSDSTSLEKGIRELEQKRNARSSRLQSLQELQKAYEGYSAGVKAILKGTKNQAQESDGIVGAVAEIIRTEAQYEIAIEASLGSNVQSIVTEKTEDARKALEYLIERKAGRATFLPMDVLNRAENEFLEVAGDIIAIASKVVAFDQKYSIVVEYLLGNILIVKDFDTAARLAEIARNKSYNVVQFVTLDGQIVSSSGIIIGGTGTESAGLLRRSREIADLKKEVSELDEQLNAVYKQRDELLGKISSFQKERERITKEFQSERILYTGMQKDISQYKQRLARLEKEISVLDSEYNTLDKEIADLHQKKTKLSTDVEEIDSKGEEIKTKVDELQSETRLKIQERDAILKTCTDLRVQLASKKQQEKGLTDNITSLDREKTQLQKTLSNYETSVSTDDESEKSLTDNIFAQESILEGLFEERSKIESEVSGIEAQRQNSYNELTEGETFIRDNRRDIDQIKQERYQIEITRTQIQMNVDALISKMRERYGISMNEFESQIKVEIQEEDSQLTEEEIEKRIDDLRTKMEKLGPVNLTAVDEYNRQKDRYDLMVAQREDLIKAKESLYNIIQRINTESRERMKTTFDAVNTNFQELFQKLFGGGQGELVMVGEGDVLESGVEIIAKPPGKKPQTVSMLSTGERSLTAISLLFALFRIKPSPFCVMDEVDAALDDANVRRFTEMVKEFSKTIQFVIITHNKRTMEIADVLYGVTMEESGVSKLVSLKM
jgi:chromosome segregation protein